MAGQLKISVIKDIKEPLLTNSMPVVNLWTEYRKDLYNLQLKTDANILQNIQIVPVNLLTYKF